MEKQIEEIKELTDGIFVNCQACLLELECNMIARYVIEEQGYRKASDVAREIFAEIEKITDEWSYDSYSAEYDIPIRKEYNGRMIVKRLNELKKKYESEGGE